jgi:signal transduction histidine kinase
VNSPGWRPIWGPLAFDVALAVAVVVPFYSASMGKGGIAGLVDRSAYPAVLIEAIHVAVAPFLIARRTAPLASATGVCLLTALNPSPAALVSAYAAAAYVTSPRRSWTVIAGLALAFAQPWDYGLGVEAAGLAAMVFVPALLGMYVGAQHRHTRALAEQEQAAIADEARTQERARLAAEMHDVITHRVSLMVLQAGALRTRAPDDAVRQAAEELRLIGCQALEELRGLVGVLRSHEQSRPTPAPEAVVLDVADLVGESRAAGVLIELHTDGSARPVSEVIARTAYRVVQEALTNVHKHAPGAQVDVTIRHQNERLQVTVSNTCPTREVEIALDGDGTGLSGLRRRVHLVGGDLVAGPSQDGGFQLDADLPASPSVVSWSQ